MRLYCILFLINGILAFFTTGCAGPKPGLFPPAKGEATRPVYVVSHGWHTGLVIPRQSIPANIWPSTGDFPKANWLETGWGEGGFYRAPQATVPLALKALFWSNPSVLHVAGFKEPVELYFSGEELVRVELSERGFNELCRYIGAQYQTNASGAAIFLQPGLYGDSRFYRATGRYYFPKTCNHWTARALRAGGCPISPFYAVTARNVIMQTSEFGCAVCRRPFLCPVKGRK